MSGVDIDGTQLRKGAADAVKRFVDEQGGRVPAELDAAVAGSPRTAARRSSSPATTSCSASIHLKDIVKGGMRERFDELRAWASAR